MAGQPLPSSAMRSELASLRRDVFSLRRNRGDGIFVPFTPVLSASTVNPNIGDTGTATAEWARYGDFVVYYGDIRFAGVGVSAGTGTYTISTPVAATDAVASGTSLAGGHWRCTGGGLFINNEIIIFPSESRMRCRYSAAHPFGAETNVTSALPWAWAAGYRIEFECWFHAAP